MQCDLLQADAHAELEKAHRARLWINPVQRVYFTIAVFERVTDARLKRKIIQLLHSFGLVRQDL